MNKIKVEPVQVIKPTSGKEMLKRHSEKIKKEKLNKSGKRK